MAVHLGGLVTRTPGSRLNGDRRRYVRAPLLKRLQVGVSDMRWVCNQAWRFVCGFGCVWCTCDGCGGGGATGDRGGGARGLVRALRNTASGKKNHVQADVTSDEVGDDFVSYAASALRYVLVEKKDIFSDLDTGACFDSMGGANAHALGLVSSLLLLSHALVVMALLDSREVWPAALVVVE